MSFEQYQAANFAGADDDILLSVGINNSVTTIVLTGAYAELPAGKCILLLSEGATLELIKVTSRTGDTLTVATRGFEGTIASAFTVAAKVYGIFSKAMYDDIITQLALAYAVGGTDVAMGDGGTGASLTPVNNSLVYSNASVLALLASANNGLLATSSSGVPSIATSMEGLSVVASKPGLVEVYRAYAGGNIDVLTDIVPSKVMQHAATLALVKIYLKDGPNTGATATFVPRINGKKIFTSAPTIAAPTQKDALDATTGWSGTGITFATEGTIKMEGTNSLKMTIDATGNRAADKTFTLFDASSLKALSFWIGADAATTGKFYITDGTNTSYFDLDNIPLVSAPTGLKFLRVYLTSEKLAAPDSNSGSNCNVAAITHMGFSSLVASRIYYVDDIELENYYSGTPNLTAVITGDSASMDCTVKGSTLPGAGAEVVFLR